MIRLTLGKRGTGSLGVVIVMPMCGSIISKCLIYRSGDVMKLSWPSCFDGFSENSSFNYTYSLRRCSLISVVYAKPTPIISVFFSMSTRTRNRLMTMACLFAAHRDSYSIDMSGYLKLDHHRCGLIVPLLAGTLADLDVVGRYEAIDKSNFDAVRSILAMRRCLEVDWDGYVGVENLFLDCDICTGNISNLPPLRVTKRPFSRSKTSSCTPGSNVV